MKQSQSYYHKKLQMGFIDINSKLPKPKFNKVISLFTGAGGLDLGLELAGFTTAVCVEIDLDCIETIKFNRPNWNWVKDNKGQIVGDIRNISATQLLETGNLKKGEVGLVVGGAPCQPFSNIGKKMGRDDSKNGDLFLEFTRIVKETQPKGFIFENVSGITQSRHSEVISHMINSFASMGYSVSKAILNAADYGVPQKRERFILLGTLNKEAPLFPLPTHYKSPTDWNVFSADLDTKTSYAPLKWVAIKEAFKNIPPDAHLRNDYVLMNISDVIKKRMTLINVDENFKVLPMELRPKCWQNGKHQGVDTFGRLNPNHPSVTIRTAAYNPSKGKYIHPKENRGLSSLEMAALQSFPMDWIFKCKKSDKITLVSAGKQIGNAVPPLLAKSIGLAMRNAI